MAPTNLNDLMNSIERPVALFLDDGGVLNDNALRAPEWLRLIAEFMPGRLGGTAEQWADANQQLFPRLWEQLKQQLADFASHSEFQRVHALSWMGEMCSFVGVKTPSENDSIALHGELCIFVGERADCAIEGSTDAVASLHGAGYRLFTASGTPS